MRDAPITDSGRTAATVNLQLPTDREPMAPIPTGVCPHCERGTTQYRFTAVADLFITTHHCIEHGDVIPRRAS